MPHPTDERTFRLPTHLRPTRYDATLSVDLEGKRFSGTERVELAAAQPADELVLHAAELDVTRATLRVADRVLEPASITPVAASETVVLRFAEPVPAGAGTLELAWTGRMTGGLRGLYLAGSGLAATQFEAADARRVFPCFDEPGFKARWRLVVEAPAAAVVLSNGAPEREEALGPGRKRVGFAETPPLPTYLVALVVGPIDGSPATSVRGVPVRTWASPEKLPLTGFGQDVAVAVLPRLEDYFGVPYAFGKVDQVGLPEFEAGAMENAGLITFREVALLLDPQTASLAQKKRVAEVVTHELAHQWFGNWVTMTWWDDLWLNEAFATWMAFKIVDRWNPAWRVWLEFDQGKAAAMHLDALRSTHPIRAEIRDVNAAGEAFDLITYEKGGAVLRMIEGYLGEERFRDGIRLYMRRHAQGNAVADDLWSALGEASGEPVVELANAWIGKPGFPLVRVAREGRRLVLEQRRFFSEPGAGEGDDSLWPVPLVVRHGDGERVTEQRVLLRERRAEVELAGGAEPAYVCANAAATGFYRVAYDAAGLDAIGRAVGRLAPAERIQLLSDEWALVRCGEREIDAFLDLVTRFGAEADHAVLDELVARLSAIDHRLLADGDRLRFAALVVTLFGPHLAALGWDAAPGEADAVRLRRAAAVRALGVVARSAGVVGEAAARLDRWIAGDRKALEPNLHDASVAMAARAGDASRFERFRALFAKETDPAFRRRWLLALASFEDPNLAARGVELAFTDEVPLQDVASFVAALLANRTARRPFWERLRADWERLHARVKGAPMLLRRIVEAMGALVERRELEEAEAFLAAHPLDEARQAIAQTLERLRQDVALRERTQAGIGRWLEAR
ncbi:M1 family metallopeptidase [Anaeromyxobacter sp. Fw109-5]|uniref:M1 family metallopeptidase n=1 Tax=Anaeromyxobacter sp. (strain Fw109-5) TaxID=404589 RepID=UPI0000ED74BD|nr:M1 family metallopeptidase [Anaeromyxobacter sp. Fw109-5]ABS26618.1 Peptidase M1 membrane alanine aminopeptidase [Anaeromyxobacter sp. Fw109-5]